VTFNRCEYSKGNNLPTKISTKGKYFPFWKLIFGNLYGKYYKLVKCQKAPVFVIPAKAGIQENQPLLDSRFRGSDGLGDFLRELQG